MRSKPRKEAKWVRTLLMVSEALTGDSSASEVRDRRGGFFIVDNALIKQYGAALGPYGLAAYAALCMYANRARECWPGQETVAAQTGMSRAKLQQALAQLEALKLVSITRREGGTNLYEIRGVPTTWAGGAYHIGTNNTQEQELSLLRNGEASPETATAEPEVTTPHWTKPHTDAVLHAWESTNHSGLRQRCLATVREAVTRRTPNDKQVPAAVSTALGLVYRELFGEQYPADLGRLMGLAKQRGGAERFTLAMLDVAAREVVGNPHDVLTKWRPGTRQPDAQQREVNRLWES